MVKIRLRRTGAKKKPTYRVVVADSRAPRDGRFIEIIGHYNPRSEPITFQVHEDRALHWLSVGAQPTDIVQKLLKNHGTLEKFSRLKEGVELETLLSEAETSATTKADPVEDTTPEAVVSEESAPEEASESSPEEASEAASEEASDAPPEA